MVQQHHQPQPVRGLPVHRMPLRRQQGPSLSSPYCLAVSSIANLPSGCNFLASQVWPSARVAAKALEEYAIDWTMPKAAAATATATTTTTTTTIICELGCGPGLPSLTAASSLGCQVIATDIDELALDLVTAASREQNLENLVTTHLYDLVGAEWVSGWMDDVDLFVMSDVFESEAIAKGAAKLTKKVLERGSSKVWVFAQTDRAQREIYLRELQNIVRHPFPPGEGLSLHWSDFESYNPEDRLWLCGLDETTVDYG